MKRLLSIILISAMMLTLGVGVCSAAEQVEPDVWDGTVADGFASGSGTKNDPYIIETAAQLAFLSEDVANGNDYDGKHIELVADIRLNDESFTFDPQTGRVEVTDGVNTAYLTTVVAEGDFNISDGFYWPGIWVDENDEVTTYGGTINEWKNIGSYYFTDTQQYGAEFSGSFNGNGHTVYGMYMNDPESHYKSLFGSVVGLFASVSNLGVADFYTNGCYSVGSVVGTVSMFASVSNCYSDGTVIASNCAGGIVGENSGTLTNCYSLSTVFEYGDIAGGIVGENSGTLKNCYNAGTVIGRSRVGAIVGSNNEQSVIQNCYYLQDCAIDGEEKVQAGVGNAGEDVNGCTAALTDTDMKKKESFDGFDFGKAWDIDAQNNGGYPYLRSPDAPIVSSEVFVDVADGAWYEGAVDHVVNKGLMGGVAADRFAPNATTTRAMVVTVLYRMEGSPETVSHSPFTDLKDAWYKDAVAWAYEHQIVNGMSPTSFAPNGEITREQIATVLCRYTEYKGYGISERADISVFPDSDSVSSWSLEAIKWANEVGLINGTDKGGVAHLDPTGKATRAQVATILMRYDENID